MPRTFIPSPHLRWRRVRWFALGISVLLVAAVVGVYQTAPSVLKKLRSAPRWERVVWSGSGVSGRVLDGNGDFANDNLVTGKVFVPLHARAIRDDGTDNRNE